MARSSEFASAANDTRWQELRSFMIAMESPPAFRLMDLNGHYTSPDKEWFYHFSDGGYSTTKWVDLVVEDAEQRKLVLQALKSIGLAGEATNEGFRVYGYLEAGQSVQYFRDQQ